MGNPFFSISYKPFYTSQLTYMKRSFQLLFFTIPLLLFNTGLKAQNLPEIKSSKDFCIGKTLTIRSEILHEDRILNIYLPNNYDPDSAGTYPVIYLLDGSRDEDFIHIAGLVQFGSFSWINMIPETIVVGISNIDRKRDYTFHTDVKEHVEQFPTAGHSADFISFIESELQPFIETHFKVNATKTLIGQSLGGLLATEILFKKPYLFNNYIIVSPSLWWGNESLMKYRPKPYQDNKSIYIAVGNEGKIMEREAKELYQKLRSVKKKNTKLYFQFLEDQNHSDALHLAVYHAFEKLFSKKKD